MFAVYVMCGAQDKDAVRLTLEQIDVVRRMCTEYQEFELVTSAQGTVQMQMGFTWFTDKTTMEMKEGLIIFLSYLIVYNYDSVHS